jgi:hypothetical protein
LYVEMSSLENGQFEEGREDMNEVVDTLPSGNEETRVCRVECFISLKFQLWNKLPSRAFAQALRSSCIFFGVHGQHGRLSSLI